MRLSIQKWGNGAAVRLHRALLKQIDSGVGGTLEVEVVDGGLLLKPVKKPEFTLDELLATCTSESVRLDDEDREWLDAPPVGKEAF